MYLGGKRVRAYPVCGRSVLTNVPCLSSYILHTVRRRFRTITYGPGWRSPFLWCWGTWRIKCVPLRSKNSRAPLVISNELWIGVAKITTDKNAIWNTSSEASKRLTVFVIQPSLIAVLLSGAWITVTRLRSAPSLERSCPRLSMLYEGRQTNSHIFRTRCNVLDRLYSKKYISNIYSLGPRWGGRCGLETLHDTLSVIQSALFYSPLFHAAQCEPRNIVGHSTMHGLRGVCHVITIQRFRARTTL